jgi:hypothetical protein
MLDLDVPGAVREYEGLVADRGNDPERWIAMSRLAELQRVGVPVAVKQPWADAPAAVREVLEKLTPLPMLDLLRQARTDSDAERDPDAPRFQDLRPATPRMIEYVRNLSLLTDRDRNRQRFTSRSTRAEPSRPAGIGPTRADRQNARDILLRALEGRAEVAKDLREIHFSEWKPPVEVKGDPTQMLARARTNLEAWMAEPSRDPQQQTLLGRLRGEIEQRATDPAAALAWLGQLPLYAERLLAEPAKTEPPK